MTVIVSYVAQVLFVCLVHVWLYLVVTVLYYVRRLFEAYAKCSTEKERNLLLADLKFGPTKR